MNYPNLGQLKELPFIFHTVNAWIRQNNNPFDLAQATLQSSAIGQVAEAVAVSHAARQETVFYIKADGEVDLALVRGKTFLPVEIKWSRVIQTNDIKLLLKYPRGILAYRTQEIQIVHQIMHMPLSRWLLLN